jgi:hypothetical protein
LASAAVHSGAVETGALLVLGTGLSLAFVPVVVFPVLRRVNEVLALTARHRVGNLILDADATNAVLARSRSRSCRCWRSTAT